MTITSVAALKSGPVRRRLGEDYAQQLLTEFTHPYVIVDQFAPTVLHQVERYSQLVDFVWRIVLSAVIVIAFIRILCWLPGDLAREKNSALFYDHQRQRDCYSEYLKNNCSETDDSDVCVELGACLATPNEGVEQVSILRFIWVVLGSFFYGLSSKVAVFCGILAGMLLYRDLQRARRVQ
jgi:hypothetical protein